MQAVEVVMFSLLWSCVDRTESLVWDETGLQSSLFLETKVWSKWVSLRSIVLQVAVNILSIGVAQQQEYSQQPALSCPVLRCVHDKQSKPVVNP